MTYEYKANLRQRNTIISLENKVKELEMQNGSLMEEQKEAEIKIERLTAEVEELRLKTMDTKQYKSWDYLQILSWIMSIEEGRFKKYEMELKKVLSEEEPSGEDLGAVDATDIKRWGIKKFNDIKLLLKCIQQLVNNNNNDGKDNNNNNNNNNDDNNIAMANEGAVSGGYYR